MIEERQIQDGNVAQNEGGTVRDGFFTGRDVESLAAQTPPRLGHLTVSDEAPMQNVLVADPLRPLAFDMERIIGCEHARLSDDVRARLANHVVEFALLLFGVVLEMIAPNAKVAIE